MEFEFSPIYLHRPKQFKCRTNTSASLLTIVFVLSRFFSDSDVLSDVEETSSDPEPMLEASDRTSAADFKVKLLGY